MHFNLISAILAEENAKTTVVKGIGVIRQPALVPMFCYRDVWRAGYQLRHLGLSVMRGCIHPN